MARPQIATASDPPCTPPLRSPPSFPLPLHSFLLALLRTGDHFTNSPGYLPRKIINFLFLLCDCFIAFAAAAAIAALLPLSLAVGHKFATLSGLDFFVTCPIRIWVSPLLNCADYLVEVFQRFSFRFATKFIDNRVATQSPREAWKQGGRELGRQSGSQSATRQVDLS